MAACSVLSRVLSRMGPIVTPPPDHTGGRGHGVGARGRPLDIAALEVACRRTLARHFELMPGGRRGCAGSLQRSVALEVREDLAIQVFWFALRPLAGTSAPNVRLADMNLDDPVQDERRIEVVSKGMSCWRMRGGSFPSAVCDAASLNSASVRGGPKQCGSMK